jgi:hypothetical protein
MLEVRKQPSLSSTNVRRGSYSGVMSDKKPVQRQNKYATTTNIQVGDDEEVTHKSSTSSQNEHVSMLLSTDPKDFSYV